MGILITVLVVLTVAAVIVARRAEPFLRARIVQELSSRFHAKVELDSFKFSIGNGFVGEWGFWAHGRGLRIWPTSAAITAGAPNRPVISLDDFRFHAPLHFKPGVPVRISEVRLNGLQINLPPHGHFLHLNTESSAGVSSKSSSLVTFRIDKIVCTNARLVHETDKPGKLPLDFLISSLVLKNFTPRGAMEFEAQLTNPRPVGAIHTTGTFGPWQTDDPGSSPVAGEYQFKNADLGTFKEIAGILNSTGRYAGSLNNIKVDGETDTPDFRLAKIGNSLHLHTNFHATVDGTNGDTWLDPVDAILGQTHFIVRGKIVRVMAAENGSIPHSIGHDINLNVNIDRGHIEDITRLASHETTPLLTGDLNLLADLDIPPGPGPMHERMKMNGKFILDQAEFTDPGVQGHLRELSFRGLGKPDLLKTDAHADIPAHMQGDFHISTGVITLPNLLFTVPGANIQLKGTYVLIGGALDFVGSAKMQATISQMVGGWKGFLLKPVDPFFKKNGAGTDVPIHVGGTASSPRIGLDFHGGHSTSPQRPDEQSDSATSPKH